MAPSIIPTSIQKTLNNPPSTWKAQANAKGFGSTPPSVQETSIKKTSSDADDEKIPEEVMYRIIKRVLASVGAPMALSFASMQLIGLIMEQHIWNVPKWFMFFDTFSYPRGFCLWDCLRSFIYQYGSKRKGVISWVRANPEELG
ncbi:hypothetical protein OIU78_000533 [Salix suchowensis]|nr:hypothetical protein OIU78_000533 [Salix suchowensis]